MSELITAVVQVFAVLWAFVTTNIIAVLGTFFAALLGASASQIISGRARTKETYRNQVRDTNTALALALYIVDKLLDFKQHNVRPIKEVFDKQKESYHKSLSKGKPLDLGPIDLAELEVLDLPVTDLRKIAYDKLFLTLPLQAAAAELVEMFRLMNKSSERRHAILKELIEKGPPTDPAQMRVLFAGPDAKGHVDERYSSAIDGIWHYLNLAIHRAMFLVDHLPQHGEIYRRAYRRKLFLGKLPQMHEPDFSKARQLGLLPAGGEFATWEKKFVTRPAKQSFLRRWIELLRSRLR